MGVITLGGVTLNPDLQLDPQLYGIDRVSAVSEWSRGGKQLVYERLDKSVPVALVGGTDWGGMTRTTMAALYALVPVVDTTYTLSYHGTTMTVRFRHEERPVISCRPIGTWRRDQEAATNLFVDVQIKLMWVVAT